MIFISYSASIKSWLLPFSDCQEAQTKHCFDYTIYFPHQKMNVSVINTWPQLSMPDTSLLRLSRSKAVRRALPRVVSPHACRFFSSLINVAWFSFQPAYGAHKHTKKKKFYTRLKALQEPDRESIRSHCSAVKTLTHAASHTVSDDVFYKT